MFLKPLDGADAPWNSKDHTLKFFNQGLEFALGTRAARVGERSKKFVKTFKTVGQKFDRARYGVNEPAKDNFGCQKRAVALEELLEEVRVFLPFVIVGIRRSEGFVDAIE